MIENSNEVSKDLEKALKVLQQACVANEKKKQMDLSGVCHGFVQP